MTSPSFLALASLALSGGAIAGKPCWVHDIAPPHPRYTQLTQMAAEVAKRTQGTLTIAINPGGKVLYPGQASLDAVRNKTVPLIFVNSAFLQSIDPDLGFLNLPFTITDQMMKKPRVAEGVLALVRDYVEPHGLKVFAIMRGADTIIDLQEPPSAHARRRERSEDPSRGPGVYQDIVKSLGATPVVFPAIEMGAALARGAMDGIITSPAAGEERRGRAEREPRAGAAVLYVFPDRGQGVGSMHRPGRNRRRSRIPRASPSPRNGAKCRLTTRD